MKSRENNFYYGHPRNRFWTVLSAIIGCRLPETVGEKKAMLLCSGIAVWDVIAECDIAGSADSSIRNVIPADLSVILGSCGIERIFANGSTAAKLYERYQKPLTCREIVTLPSTSPANAAWSTARLTEEWSRHISGLINK